MEKQAQEKVWGLVSAMAWGKVKQGQAMARVLALRWKS